MGGFGEVFFGKWRNEDVAIKRISLPPLLLAQSAKDPLAERKLQSLVDSLRQEANLFWLCKHENVVQLRGMCLELSAMSTKGQGGQEVSREPPNLCLVMEYAYGGSLNQVLEDSKGHIALDILLDWAKQIACGIKYLHDEAPIPLIHRDLKSCNSIPLSRILSSLFSLALSRIFFILSFSHFLYFLLLFLSRRARCPCFLVRISFLTRLFPIFHPLCYYFQPASKYTSFCGNCPDILLFFAFISIYPASYSIFN